MVAAAEVLSLLLTLLIPGGQAVAQRVAGLLHHSVELYHPDLSLLVLDVIWQFLTQNKTTKVVMYHKDQLSIYSPQFTDRLEVSHKGTKLCIKDLRMEDTGVYTAVITFTDNEIRHVPYILTVYEPVPSPAIRSEVTDDNPERCNVTLHCDVQSNTSDFSYTWKYRLRDSEYQDINSTGSSIHISLPPDHQDMDVTCIVHNPADQKNISISVTSSFSTDRPLHRYVLLIGLLIFILIVGIGMYMLWKIRQKKTNKRGELEHCMPENLSTEPSTSINQFLPYDQIPHGSNLPTQKFETLYTFLESKT